ncbi:hypothetical protein U4960_05000 [Altererythrobacter sp. H2]|uniref:hypothetical protein n=1 Tax=Altererythrobacter sp. H2 TaxID=3108391 RepID=UPI000BD93D45|nr:hypothetical protein [Altererythrobacter sp. H2]OZA94819.1 MAG: hypothetical protein B7X57_00145 [Erythrobacter sp. 34-65-8]WRK96683.1 hypothetical protein U4960_05000 [Altererythrobacter sp. H2]
MNIIKGLVGLAATAWIAAAVAYSVSAPRNVEDAMNQPMDSLGGQSINQQVAATQAEVRRDQCERFTQMAQEAWDQAIDQGTADRDAARLDEMDRQAENFCKP